MMVRFLAEGRHGLLLLTLERGGARQVAHRPLARWNHPCLIVMPRCRLSYAKRVQTESRTTSPRLIVMPRCSLYFAKIGK